MEERRYKYMSDDFGEMPARLNHLTIYLNFAGEFVETTNTIEMTASTGLNELALDANNLDIVGVEWCNGPSRKGDVITYEYARERNKLLVHLPRRVEKGEKFSVKTVTRCYPSDHILEGIYRDTTPPGAPQQYMSQCQQWGFQRIMPILDDCRAKCTMTTTIEADSAYTHLISNGNISRRTNPDGRAIPKPGDPSRQLITYENSVPMAPYLFLACVGTWDTLVDHVTFPSGRTVSLEYLVPPGATNDVRIPMEILKEAVLWIEKTQGYEYTGETYRTICMNKSNFGGMENVGNTTIVTDAALITEHTLDVALLYSHAVIVHEFEHNQCGSETTMETPFDVWLNEAYTVDVERQFMNDLFDPAFIRLSQVDSIRNPLLGPLAIEDAGHAGKIVREGFNDPDELIDGVTYVKAAEVIRMLRLVLGKEKFLAGKALYFSRYRNGNANTDQFFACFEEVSGRDLRQFKEEWLYRIGYPKVTAATQYDPAEGTYRVRFRQELREGKKPFHLPIELALVDTSGRDIKGTASVFELTEEEGELVFRGISQEPSFASMNRDYSFYGTFTGGDGNAELLSRQTRLDPNAYSRVDAFRRLTDIERIKLLHCPEGEAASHWLELFGEILADSKISSSLKAYFLRIEEQPLDRKYSTWYRELVTARESLMRAANRRYRDRLVNLFQRIDTYSSGKESSKKGIEDRMLKQVLLDLIVVDDSADSHKIILDHYYAATTATDRFSALLALNRSSSPFRREVLEKTYEKWHEHLSGYANYLRIVSSGTREDVFEMIEAEKNRPGFDITQPTWCRALYLPMAANNKMVWTERGIDWIGDAVIELAPINPVTTGRLLNTFQQVKNVRSPLREKVESALARIMKNVSEEKSPSVYGQAVAYLSEKK
jgi:aminopeptidase N